MPLQQSFVLCYIIFWIHASCMSVLIYWHTHSHSKHNVVLCQTVLLHVTTLKVNCLFVPQHQTSHIFILVTLWLYSFSIIMAHNLHTLILLIVLYCLTLSPFIWHCINESMPYQIFILKLIVSTSLWGLSYVIRKDLLWSKASNSKWAQNFRFTQVKLTNPPGIKLDNFTDLIFRFSGLPADTAGWTPPPITLKQKL